MRDFDAMLTAEQVHKLQCEERLTAAKYKMSYIIWKCKVLWPVFDFISRYFVVIVYITIFCFALYYQIAVLWLVMISLSMLQFVSVSNSQFALQKRLKEEYFGNESTRELAMVKISKESRRVQKLEDRWAENKDNIDCPEKLRKELD